MESNALPLAQEGRASVNALHGRHSTVTAFMNDSGKTTRKKVFCIGRIDELGIKCSIAVTAS